MIRPTQKKSEDTMTQINSARKITITRNNYLYADGVKVCARKVNPMYIPASLLSAQECDQAAAIIARRWTMV